MRYLVCFIYFFKNGEILNAEQSKIQILRLQSNLILNHLCNRNIKEKKSDLFNLYCKLAVSVPIMKTHIICYLFCIIYLVLIIEYIEYKAFIKTPNSKILIRNNFFHRRFVAHEWFTKPKYLKNPGLWLKRRP